MRTKSETKERKPRLLQHVVERYLSSLSKPNKTLSSLELIKFLNVCSYEVSDDDKIKWITKFLTSQGLKVPSLTSAILIQKGGICYLFNEGYTLESITKEQLTQQFFQKKQEKTEKVVLTPISKEEKKLKERDFLVNQAILDIDAIIDTFIKNKKTKIDLPSSFTSLSKEGIALVLEEPSFITLKKELELALSSPISETAEAYSNFTELQKKRFLEFINKLFSFNPSPVVKTQRQTNKPKSILIEQKLKHFQPLSSLGGIPSVPLKAIFSSTSLLLVNTTRGFLVLVSAEPGKFLDIHRTSLINIDETQTLVRRLTSKIPLEEQLEEFRIGNANAIKTKLGQMKPSSKEFSGRCSEDVLIFRVWS